MALNTIQLEQLGPITQAPSIGAPKTPVVLRSPVLRLGCFGAESFSGRTTTAPMPIVTGNVAAGVLFISRSSASSEDVNSLVRIGAASTCAPETVGARLTQPSIFGPDLVIAPIVLPFRTGKQLLIEIQAQMLDEGHSVAWRGILGSDADLPLARISAQWESDLSSAPGAPPQTGAPAFADALHRPEESQGQWLLQRVRNRKAIQLLAQWLEEDESITEDGWDQLRQALDDDRISSHRKLFP